MGKTSLNIPATILQKMESQKPGINLNIYIVFIVVIAVGFLVIARPTGLYFLNDDFIHIPSAAAGNFSQTHFLRPVADFTLWLDSRIWDKNPLGFHITNLLIHIINTFLVFFLAKKTFERYSIIFCFEKSIFLAIFFLVYAYHSEPVFWIIGRGGTLAAFFILSALGCYVISSSLISMFASLGFFITGLFTYEFVWILPALIVMFQILDFAQKRRTYWRWSIGFWLLFILFIWYRTDQGFFYSSPYAAQLFTSFDIKGLLYNYTCTIARCFLPPMESDILFMICFIILVSMFALLLFIYGRNRKRLQFLIIPAFCLAIACLPSVSRGIDIHDSEGERFLYVPSIFACWLTVEVLFILFRQARQRALAILLITMIHFYIFCVASESYRYAGMVARQSLECINNADPAGILLAENVPSQIKGALIFRKGFDAAIAWMLPGKFDSVSVISKTELKHYNNFRCKESLPGYKEKKPEIIISWTSDGLIIVE